MRKQVNFLCSIWAIKRICDFLWPMSCLKVSMPTTRALVGWEKGNLSQQTLSCCEKCATNSISFLTHLLKGSLIDMVLVLLHPVGDCVFSPHHSPHPTPPFDKRWQKREIMTHGHRVRGFRQIGTKFSAQHNLSRTKDLFSLNEIWNEP